MDMGTTWVSKQTYHQSKLASQYDLECSWLTQIKPASSAIPLPRPILYLLRLVVVAAAADRRRRNLPPISLSLSLDRWQHDMAGSALISIERATELDHA